MQQFIKKSNIIIKTTKMHLIYFLNQILSQQSS